MSFDLHNATIAGIINPTVGSPNLLSGQVEYANFNYAVKKSASATITVLFGLLSTIHLIQAIRSRRWFLLYTVCLGGFIEMGGWAARLASAVSTKWDPTYGGYWFSNDSAFLAQICMLIFAPAFIIAGCYVILGVIVSRSGYRYCRLHPKTYTILFLTGDLTSLVIQAIGGGTAASANNDHAKADKGAHIMVGGVIFQMVVMVAFTFLLLEFAYRYVYDRPTTQISPFAWMTKKTRENARRNKDLSNQASPNFATRGSAGDKTLRYQLMGLGGVTLFIFIRSIYRTIELLGGWNGKIINDQTLFDILDGAMIILCLACLNIAHPVFLLKQRATSFDDEKTVLSTDSVKV